MKYDFKWVFLSFIFLDNFENLKIDIIVNTFFKIRNFFIYVKNRVYLWFKTTGISEKIMSFLNTKTGKKYRVVELDKGIYCLSDILGGRKT